MLSWDSPPAPFPSGKVGVTHLTVQTQGPKGSHHLPSPLPSPTSSKTNSFFGSPYLKPTEDVPTPPTSLSRASSVGRTHTFFSSSQRTDTPSPPPSLRSVPSSLALNAEKKAKSLNDDFFHGLPPSARPTPPPSLRSVSPGPPSLRTEPTYLALSPDPKSVNNDFLSAFPPSARPTPPPSLRSGSPPANSPPKGSLLARIFPSRNRPSPVQPLDLETPTTWREFYEVDLESHPTALFASPVSASPTTGTFSASTTFFHIPTSPATSTRAVSSHPTSPSNLAHEIGAEDSPPTVQLADPIRRETHHVVELKEDTHPCPGAVLRSDSGNVTVTLVRALGQGAFSSVWLAREVVPEETICTAAAAATTTNGRRALLSLRPENRRPSESVARRKADRRVHGLRPSVSGISGMLVRQGTIMLREMDGEGASVPSAFEDDDEEEAAGRVVAVKMMDRAMCDENDRTRISFVREVEVLRHISHPSIVSYLHSFTTPTHHCLVLEHIGGGEIFDVVNSDAQHARLTEPFLRRIFGELCRAVGWMHGVHLVHRDIKLENILLTSNPFASTSDPLPHPSALTGPLVKLTDFGLSRFIEPSAPMLTTRCGSEAYAAPEVITGKPYDGRQTDAWACGVVLYALATRRLPFDRNGGGGRGYLMRIAQGEYTWPEPDELGTGPPTPDSSVHHGSSGGREPSESSASSAPDSDARLGTPGVRAVVGRLLNRDPVQRSRIIDLWDEETWMRGEGAPRPPIGKATPGVERTVGLEFGDGLLVDGDCIANVARQEMVR